MVTGVYASITTYNNKEQIKQIFSDRNQNTEIDYYYDWAKEFEYDDNGSYTIQYKKITDYKEYLTMKDIWNDIIEMNEEDFNENFVLLLMAPEKTYISNIYCEENTTIIEISRNGSDEEISEENSLISTKISNSLNEEKIDIILNPNLPEMMGYTKLEDITEDYTKENAIADGCFVVENHQIISYDKSQIDKFIEKINNNTSSSMRIVEYNDKFIYIKDISYKDGSCKVSIYNITNKETYFGEGNEIIKTTNEKMGLYSYILVDKDEWEKYGTDKMHIFSIYIENN